MGIGAMAIYTSSNWNNKKKANPNLTAKYFLFIKFYPFESWCDEIMWRRRQYWLKNSWLKNSLQKNNSTNFAWNGHNNDDFIYYDYLIFDFVFFTHFVETFYFILYHSCILYQKAWKINCLSWFYFIFLFCFVFINLRIIFTTIRSFVFSMKRKIRHSHKFHLFAKTFIIIA